MLNKEICKKCINQNHQKEGNVPWNKSDLYFIINGKKITKNDDELWDKFGKVACQYSFDIININKIPDTCYFKLEQLLKGN